MLEKRQVVVNGRTVLGFADLKKGDRFEVVREVGDEQAPSGLQFALSDPYPHPDNPEVLCVDCEPSA